MTKKMLNSLQASIYQYEEKLLKNFIEEIRIGISNHFLLNFFAPPGFGKTVFLEGAWSEYGKIMPASFVHVDEFKKNNIFSICELLIQILDELDDSLPKRISQLPVEYRNSNDREELAGLIVDVISRVKDAEKVILFLLDDYDHLPSEESCWFEKKLLAPIARIRNVAIILTSEFELRFTDGFELRMRLESCEIRSWSSDAIAHAYPEYSEIATRIHEITGGMPLMTKGLIQQLVNSRVNDAAEFQSDEQRLIRIYYRTLVEENIFKELSQSMCETLQILSLLRRFDIVVLKEILPKILPEAFTHSGTAEFLDLIEQLGSRIQWRMQGGYAINDALRMVIKGYVQVEKPDLYKLVNQTAIFLYRELLKEEYHEYYLMELLYHGLVLFYLVKDASKSPSVQVGDELYDFLYGDSVEPVQLVELDSLRNSLLRDPDLKTYVSDGVLKEIQRLIRVRIIETDLINRSESETLASA